MLVEWLWTSIPIQVGDEAEAARLRAEIEELVQRVPLVPKWWQDDGRMMEPPYRGLMVCMGLSWFIIRFQSFLLSHVGIIKVHDFWRHPREVQDGEFLHFLEILSEFWFLSFGYLILLGGGWFIREDVPSILWVVVLDPLRIQWIRFGDRRFGVGCVASHFWGSVKFLSSQPLFWLVWLDDGGIAGECWWWPKFLGAESRKANHSMMVEGTSTESIISRVQPDVTSPMNQYRPEGWGNSPFRFQCFCIFSHEHGENWVERPHCGWKFQQWSLWPTGRWTSNSSGLHIGVGSELYQLFSCRWPYYDPWRIYDP